MPESPADRLSRWLETRSEPDLTPTEAASLRRSVVDTSGTPAVVVEPHGTIVGFTMTTGGRRRVIEIDRRGTLGTLVHWTADGALIDASVRSPDGSWLTIEPRVTKTAPWGVSDTLWSAERPGLATERRDLTIFSAVDYAHVDAIPTLAEPARVPPGGGTAILNFIAALAHDQHATTLTYRGPYPTEQLFLALLESFRYDAGAADPLDAFISGALAWTPAPHERVFAADGVYVQLRDRVEKVVWRGRVYYRPDWQGIARHAARRVRDSTDGARCSLWALGRAIEDHLRVTLDADVHVMPHPQRSGTARAVSGAVRDGMVETIAATSASQLVPFIREIGARLAMDWRGVSGDLVEIAGDVVSFSLSLRATARALIVDASDRAAKLAAALATITEMAALLGDALRARAQAAIAALPEPQQRGLFETPEASAADGACIAAAVASLLEDLSAD